MSLWSNLCEITAAEAALSCDKHETSDSVSFLEIRFAASNHNYEFEEKYQHWTAYYDTSNHHKHNIEVHELSLVDRITDSNISGALPFGNDAAIIAKLSI